jgi:hypothetical protein
MASLERAVDRFERSHPRRATTPGASSTGKNVLQVRIGFPSVKGKTETSA